jgi:hypothetical protein
MDLELIACEGVTASKLDDEALGKCLDRIGQAANKVYQSINAGLGRMDRISLFLVADKPAQRPAYLDDQCCRVHAGSVTI